MITDIVDSLSMDGVSRSKQLCYTSLSDYIDTASQLLTVYMHHQQPGELTSISIIIIILVILMLPSCLLHFRHVLLFIFVSDIAIFVLKRDIKLQLTN